MDQDVLESDPPRQVDPLGATVEHRLGTDVDEHPADLRAAQLAADPVGLLEDRDLDVVCAEGMRHRCAGDAAADDDDVWPGNRFLSRHAPRLPLLCREPIRGGERPRGMNASPVKKFLVVIAALVLVVIGAGIVAGLLGSGSGDDARSTADSGSIEPALMEAPAGGVTDADALTTSRDSAPAPLQEPSRIRTGSLTIRSDDLHQDLAVVRSIAQSFKGTIGSESSHDSGEGTSAQITLRIPEASFDAAMDRLEDVGKVTHREVTDEDVTTQVIDVDARVKAQRASVTSLEKLMARARTVGEVMAVERELAQRQGELDSLLQQQRYLADQTSMSTITVMLDDAATVSEDDNPGFVGGLAAGWKALGSFLTGAATVLGALLPFAGLALLLGLPVWFVVRRRRHRAVPDAG